MHASPKSPNQATLSPSSLLNTPLNGDPPIVKFNDNLGHLPIWTVPMQPFTSTWTYSSHLTTLPTSSITFSTSTKEPNDFFGSHGFDYIHEPSFVIFVPFSPSLLNLLTFWTGLTKRAVLQNDGRVGVVYGRHCTQPDVITPEVY